MNPVLTEKQLGVKFDIAIKGLENNDGEPLMNLAALLHYVGLATDEPHLFLLSDVFGELGHHVNTFYPLQATPIPLTKEQLPHYQQLYRTAKEESLKAIKELRVEVCEKDNPNHTALVRNLGSLLKHSHELRAKRDSVLRSQPPMPGMRGGEE